MKIMIFRLEKIIFIDFDVFLMICWFSVFFGRAEGIFAGGSGEWQPPRKTSKCCFNYSALCIASANFPRASGSIQFTQPLEGEKKDVVPQIEFVCVLLSV